MQKTRQTINQQLSYPLVFKPVDGVGCNGLSLLKEESQIEKAIAKIKSESKSSYFIAQEFIEGESVSVSLLATKNTALAVSLNRQNIAMTGPEGSSSYDGGCVPLDHPFKQEAFDLAEKVVKSIYGLWGYVGVDLVLGLDMPYMVDVNPRLTTSYVGLRKVVNFNLAKAIENAVLKSNLPDRPENRGIACFLKTETPKPTMVTFKNIVNMDAVVSPAFPLEDNAKSCALLIGNGATLDEAIFDIEEAKKKLYSIIG